MICPYGTCTMRNVCKTHCVRLALENNGWIRTPNGGLERKPKEEPSQVVHNPCK